MKKTLMMISLAFLALIGFVVTIFIFKDNIQPFLKESDIMDTSEFNGQFDVNVRINIKISLDESVKDVEPNIIKAARAVMFEYYCDLAKWKSYKGFVVNEYVDIFEVIPTGENYWEVRYREKSELEKEYDERFYSKVTVHKEELGAYKGYIINSSPKLKGDETF